MMNTVNEEVQQKISIEPMGTVAKTIQLAMVYEEGAIRQQSFEKMEKPNIKTEVNEITFIKEPKDGPQPRNVSDVKEYLLHL